MKILLSILAIACITLSCSEKAGLTDISEPSPVDSFTVSDIDIGQQVQDFRHINDTALCSYDLINKTLVFFYRNKEGNYKAAVKKEIDADFWSAFFIGDDQRKYFINRERDITVYDSAANTKVGSYSIRHKLPYLNDTFALASANNAPLLKIRDTLIAVVSPCAQENFKNYYKEQEIAEFKVNKENNVINYIRSYITKPTNLTDYEFHLGMFCFYDNQVFLLYPPIDTLYMFNRSTNTASKIKINNPDYKLPDKFTCKPFKPEYGSCATKYALHNFSYTAIHFNPITKHFLLFYTTPVSDKIKGRMPDFNDQPLQVLVLDEKLNHLQHLVLKSQFADALSFFFVPGKGLAMPIYKGDQSYETTQFYVYNF